VCFPVNVTLESESDLQKLSCLSLPIHTSANAASVGDRVDLDDYSLLGETTVFLGVTPCALAKLHGVTSQERVIFVMTAMRTSNLNIIFRILTHLCLPFQVW
jgi:hypothetical protein